MGFAQSVETRGRVARNIYAFAQTATIAHDARIDGNATVFASESEIEGTVGKDVHAAAASVNVVSPAHIGGNLTAKVNKTANVHIASGAVIAGKTDIQTSQPAPSKYSMASFYIWQTIWLAAAFITGLVLFRIVPVLS